MKQIDKKLAIDLDDFDKKFTSHEEAARRAVINNGIAKAAFEPTLKQPSNAVFSIDLTTNDKEKTSDQKQSGRCWLYAALNTVRHDMAKKLRIENFELSENYLYFLDKLEKSNYFLENIIKTAKQDFLDDDVVTLLRQPQEEGGYWENAVCLIKKYGVVPKSIMPETVDSQKTNLLNKLINLRLRKSAIAIRKLAKTTKSDNEIKQIRAKTLDNIYKILTIVLGKLPTVFDYVYRDTDKNIVSLKDMTPLKFYKEYGSDTTYFDFVCVPNNIYKYNQPYSVKYSGNVIGQENDGAYKFMNLGFDDFKSLVVKQLEAGKRVWFGSDVTLQSTNEGILNDDLMNFDDLFSQDLRLSRDDGIFSRNVDLNHAMVFCGVDLDQNNKPIKWKVENSWGEKDSHDNYYIMDDNWFNKYVIGIIASGEFVSSDIKNNYKKPSIIIDSKKSFV